MMGPTLVAQGTERRLLLLASLVLTFEDSSGSLVKLSHKLGGIIGTCC